MMIVKISFILVMFCIIPNFSYSSVECVEVFDSRAAAVQLAKFLKNTRYTVSRQLSDKEEQTLLHLYNFIQGQSEPLSPKSIFNDVAFVLEKAGFNLYELWNIAHSNVLEMSFRDRRNFKRLLKGKFSDNELGLPESQRYPKELQIGSYFNPVVRRGSIVYAYHHSNSYRNPNDMYVNNSHYLLARFPGNPLGRGHQVIFGWVDLADTRRVKVKEPMNRYITGSEFFLRSDEPLGTNAFAVHFLYNGRIIKEYLPSYINNWFLHLGWLRGDIDVQKTEAIIPNRRRDIGLLRYSFQRLKAREASY